MPLRPLLPSLYSLTVQGVNVFFIQDGDEIAMIDAGPPEGLEDIILAVRGLGAPLRHVMVTHCHAAQTANLAVLKKTTGCKVYMHREDGQMLRHGKALRPMEATPGLWTRLLRGHLAAPAPEKVPSLSPDVLLQGGESLPADLQAMYLPGHTAGHMAYLWRRQGGVMFVGDAAVNVAGLALHPAYEDPAQARESLARLAKLEFQYACFGHGPTLNHGAWKGFKKRWGTTTSSL